MFGDIGKLMKVYQDMKTRMPAMREELDTRTFTAEAGGGVVTAAVNGRLGLVDLRIDPSVLTDADAEMLADLVKAAVAAAQGQAAQAAADMMNELTGGMNLPGMEGLMG